MAACDTLVIREQSGDVVELETFTALDRVKRASAILLSSEDAQRFRSGALTRSISTDRIESTLTRWMQPERASASGIDKPVAPRTKRTYKRRDKRAEA